MTATLKKRPLELQPEAERLMTSTQVAAALGVSSANTIKNWLEGGAFPGAFKTFGGHWRFPVDDVEAMKSRLMTLRARKSRGDLALPADLDEGPEPPRL